MTRERYQISLTPGTNAAITQAAAREGVTKTAFLDRAINHALDAQIVRLATERNLPLCEAEAWLAGTGGLL